MSVLNLFKSCNFRISLKDQKAIELMVQEVNLPGITLGQMDLGWQSMKDKRTGDAIDFNDLTLQIILDEDLNTFREIYSALILAHNPATNELEVKKQVFDGFLNLTTNKNNIQHSIHFYDAWIKSIDDIQLSHTTGEDEQLVCTLNIVYNFYLFEG
jgi:hypothetical protein